jgi:guanine nucleotide-binding protein subunit alpha
MESGKSTIVKQMLFLSDGGLWPPRQDLLSVQANLLYAAQILVTSMRELKIKPAKPVNQEFSDFLMKYDLDHDPDTPLEPKVGDAISSLWKDDSIDKLMEHRTRFYLPDSTP